MWKGERRWCRVAWMPRWDSSRISALGFLVYEDTRVERHVDILTELSSR